MEEGGILKFTVLFGQVGHVTIFRQKKTVTTVH